MRYVPGSENLIPATKGEVRNPDGRPKGSKNASTIFRRFLAVGTGKHHPITGEELDHYDALCLIMIQAALKGDLASAKEIMNRLEGMPRQPLEHSGHILNDLSEDEIRSKLDELKNRKA